MTKNLLEVADQLMQVKDGPINAAVMRGWETAIRSVVNLNFTVGWLDELLKKVKDRNDPCVHLSGQISQLEEKLVNCSKTTVARKTMLNQLLADVGVASDEVLRAETAEKGVPAELEEKR